MTLQEVSVRLHDDVEMIEEKRARYEEELDRVNDLLTDSESRRQTLQKEVDMLVDQVGHFNKLTYELWSTPLFIMWNLSLPLNLGHAKSWLSSLRL